MRKTTERSELEIEREEGIVGKNRKEDNIAGLKTKERRERVNVQVERSILRDKTDSGLLSIITI